MMLLSHDFGSLILYVPEKSVIIIVLNPLEPELHSFFDSMC